MKIACEHLTAEMLSGEITTLGQKNWNECSIIKKDTCSFHGDRDFKIELNAPVYLGFAESGQLIVMTLRDEEGTLQGFSLVIFYNSLHHAPVLCANVDAFYIEPGHRAYMRSFITAIEKQFSDRGVVVVGWPVSPFGKLFDILKLMGYAPDDVVMEKRFAEFKPCA